jgi:hypothetical protein
MDIEKLVADHGGYLLNNKARVTIDGVLTIIARAGEHDWELTDEGAAFVASSASDVAVPETKPRERKVKSVESAGIEVSEVEVE